MIVKTFSDLYATDEAFKTFADDDSSLACMLEHDKWTTGDWQFSDADYVAVYASLLAEYAA